MATLVMPQPIASLPPEYAEKRRRRLGASDIVTALGFDEYKSPRELWAEKTGLIELTDVTAEEPEGPAALGVLLEPVIAQLYANRVGLPVYSGGEAELGEWAVCQIDRVCEDAERGRRWIVEIKSRSHWSGKSQEWGDDDSLDVPRSVLVQVLMQQHLSELTETADVAVLVDREFRVLRVPYDRELAEKISERAFDWWQTHIKDGVEPTVVRGSDYRWLTRTMRRAIDETKEINAAEDETAAQLLQEFRDASRRAKDAEEAHEQAKAKVLDLLQREEARRLVHPEIGKITRVAVKGRTSVSYKDICEAYIDAKVLKQALQEERFVTLGAGYEKLQPTWPKAK